MSKERCCFFALHRRRLRRPLLQRPGADAVNGLDVVLTINATDDHGLDSICLSNTYVSGDACT